MPAVIRQKGHKVTAKSVSAAYEDEPSYEGNQEENAHVVLELLE